MSRDELRRAVLDALKMIAPDLDERSLRADRPLRGQVDLDSMDWLNLLAELHRRLGVDIPEADYASLRTLDALLDYLSAKVV